MNSRKQIEGHSDYLKDMGLSEDSLTLEVLLDIRELLEEIAVVVLKNDKAK